MGYNKNTIISKKRKGQRFLSGKVKMNIVYMFADQLRRQSCGYAGDLRAQTPNIDRLA